MQLVMNHSHPAQPVLRSVGDFISTSFTYMPLGSNPYIEKNGESFVTACGEELYENSANGNYLTHRRTIGCLGLPSPSDESIWTA